MANETMELRTSLILEKPTSQNVNMKRIMKINRSTDCKLLFQDINVFIDKTHILHDVSGSVHSRQVLAVMGPSGSGKTTLLNAIAGREAMKSGELQFNDQRLNKQIRRNMAYVLQEDLFFSNLTLWETLYFTAMLNLPKKIQKAEKLRRIDEIIETLDLEKCRNTRIGGIFQHGLSGGEKKRTSIACELLTNPRVMLLDEPTSGLDSSTAFNLMVQLKTYAETANKAIIVTIHQPSSQVFHMFSKLLLLAEGHVVYYGKAEMALDFFAGEYMICEKHYNPADFMLEVVKKDKAIVQKIINAWKLKRSNFQKISERNEKNNWINGDGSKIEDVCLSDIKIIDQDDRSETCYIDDHLLLLRWQSSFWTQLVMLTWRNFKESKSRLLSKYVIGSSLCIALSVGLLWFQIDRSHETIRDRMGWSFFIIAFWGFAPMSDAIISFPTERAIMMKERAAGSYRLSAYYLAKQISELPLILSVPIAFVIVTYWMAGLKGVPEFFASMFIILLSALNAQGFGYVIGAATMDFQLAITSATTFMLCSLVFGGYYSQRFPPWFLWVRYLSILHYPFAALSILEFSDTPDIYCSNVTSAEFSRCNDNHTEVITSKMMLEDATVTMPMQCYIYSLILMTLIIRIIGYFMLKIKTKQKYL